MMILYGLVAAFGMFLAVDAFFPRPVKVRLTGPDDRALLPRLMDTFFTPAGKRVARIGRRDWEEQRSDLEERLARAGYPPPFLTAESVMGYRIFTAGLFAGMIGIFALILSFVMPGGLGGLELPFVIGAGLMGWFMPNQSIQNAESQRKKQLTLDAASTLDRLAIYISAGYALPMALRELSERPGGAWIGEFKQIAADYSVTQDFKGALQAAGRRCGQLQEITRVTERLEAAYDMGGGGLAQTLRRMAGDARVRIKLLLTERGYKNAVMMVIPAFFAIVAIALLLIAPGAMQLVGVLGG
jgi:tight adherence protein C